MVDEKVFGIGLIVSIILILIYRFERRVVGICLVVIIILGLFYRYEKFTSPRGLIGGVLPILRVGTNIRPVINTPIEDLRVGLKKFKDFSIPEFLCYNFYILPTAQDQGNNCGSCWAFVVSGLLGDRISIHKDKRVAMSAQHLLQCYDYPNGCDGETPERVFKWMENTRFKLTFNKLLPYREKHSKTIKQSCPDPPLVGIDVLKGSLYRIVNKLNKDDELYNEKLRQNIKNMKLELVESGPFFATILVYDDLFKFVEESGPYVSNFKKFVGGHAIIVVGYCEASVDPRRGYSDGYWICKNSWGEYWPKGSPPYPGYFTIAMGLNMCGIESRCGGIDPNITLSDEVASTAYTNFREYAAEFEV
jgi:hypothetical protein